MLPGWLLLLLSMLYVATLFVIAYYGDKRVKQGQAPAYSALVYSLSIAVYCTSWTFYGAVGTAARSGWDYLPIYLGPIIFFLFFWKVLDRMIRISKEQNITSIADFVAARYGRSQALAVLVTLIAVIGILPYIALQLKAVAIGYDVLTGANDASMLRHYGLDTAFLVAIALAVFSILFGTRYLDATENHYGMMLAIAFESVVKLLAFVAVGLFAAYSVFDGVQDVWNEIQQRAELRELFSQEHLKIGFFTQTLLAFVVMFCLPRQFHVSVVENTNRKDLKLARWLFPIYVTLFSICVIPIVVAGLTQIDAGVANADQFVLLLPLARDQGGLALLAFLGGFSAATGMVIVATVALSTMICNDVVVPILIKSRLLGFGREGDVSRLLLRIRRVAIVAILLIAYLYFRFISSLDAPLSQLGLMAFVAAAQFAPAILGGLYWKEGNRDGALRGLLVGFGIWFYTLFIPTLVRGGLLPRSLLDDGLAGIAWLKPEALLGLSGVDPVSHAVFWSLLANVTCYVFYSLTKRQSIVEQILATSFVGDSNTPSVNISALPWRSATTVGDLHRLVERFAGRRSTHRFFAEFERSRGSALSNTERANVELARACERQLAAIIGASSSRVVMTSALRGRGMLVEDAEAMLDEASQVLSFNKELLFATMENISQGISVVDADLNLVAWNQQYLKFFSYPDGLIRVGRPVEDLVRFNAEHGLCGKGDVQSHVDRRLQHMRNGNAYTFERTRSDGKVIQVQGKPLPGGGFVTTFLDVTEFKAVEHALKEVNENLERRVSQRTEALTEVNAALIQAKTAADRANKSKTQFIAAASHDLLQPLNAARLFTSALLQSENTDKEKNHQLVRQIDNSLTNTENLLSALLDISKLDAGAFHAKPRVFDLDAMFTSLNKEYRVLARNKGVDFRCHSNSYAVYSDKGLVRRILQNFISNAIRYSNQGSVLLGCRYRHEQVQVEVWDTGPGIPADKLDLIFEEFQRLPSLHKTETRGLGLGLAITKRIAKVLDIPIGVRSVVGKGSVFFAGLPRARSLPVVEVRAEKQIPGSVLAGTQVLCIDNELSILEGMSALCTSWGCDIAMASSLAGAREAFPSEQDVPDIVVVDYHLDEDKSGVDILLELREQWRVEVPAIVITADYTDALRNSVMELGLHFMRKPLKPAKLRALFTNIMSKSRRELAKKGS